MNSKHGIIARNSIYGLFNDNGEVLDKESRTKARIRMEVWERETKRQTQIRSGVCPSCGGPLTRGKRNKTNDYKREWGCSECFTIHTI